ncbi:exodeoxyribonuclease V subunit gamma [Endothiovibrio diazotrophicus]
MLNLYHSNRLERLLDRLVALTGEPLGDPLADEMILVQNQGMARWLSQRLAERAGIAANLAFPLPASFVWQLFRDQLDEVPEHTGFDRDTLLWRVSGELPALLDRPGFEPLQRYLAVGDAALRRYQLARRIADLFDQYLVYRPDFIEAWERGEETHWQAQLWRRLVEVGGGGEPLHRARLLARFRDKSSSGALDPARLPRRIFLFGHTALAPAYLEVLARVAAVTEVHLLVLNPSLNYWGDIADEKRQARLRALWRQHGRAAEAEHLSVGNPLLASMGGQGREFLEQLHHYPCADEELFAPPDPATLLGVLQLDILFLQRRGGDGEPVMPLAADDRSFQLHVAHSPMREVQILHDRLLDLFERLPGLTPREVVVMAPDIDVYAPLVEAVFGAAPAERFIPWSVADRRQGAGQPVLQSLLALLELPRARFTASEVMALVESPAVMRRLRLDEGAVERIRTWVAEAGVRWGLDGAQRTALGLPGDEGNSWRFGLDRLLLGYAMPPADGAAAPLVGGYLPYPDVEGGEARHLGALAALIERLDRWRRRLALPASPEEWPGLLNALVDTFFAPDEEEAAALQTVREALDALRLHCRQAGYREPLELAVVREHLADALAQPGGHQRFLTGRVSFCNMVPMRSIPFRVVCLLGMNDRDYPRNQRPPGFDLMAAEPRLGDRSRREDDRYLFLEALLSAREVFYLSYVGHDIRDNALKVPSVLVSELLETVERGFAVVGGGAVRDQVVTEHPLQPFSPRYFADDPRLFSYAAEWLEGGEGTGPFLAEALPEPEASWREVDLERLIRFFRNPARFLLRERLGVALERAEDGLEDEETFALDALQGFGLKQGLLEGLIDGADPDALRAAALARGDLPPAPFGRLELDDWSGRLGEWAEALRAQRAEPLAPLELLFEGAGLRLTGWLRGVTGQGLLRYRPAKLKAEDRLALWIEHLALHLSAPSAVARVSRFEAEDHAFVLGPVADPAALLEELLHLYAEGLREPLPLFPRTALRYVEQLQKKGEEAALKAAVEQWNGNEWSGGGEGANPYYDLAFRGRDPLDARFVEVALRVIGPLLAAQD